jgi:hypothetical protein
MAGLRVKHPCRGAVVLTTAPTGSCVAPRGSDPEGAGPSAVETHGPADNAGLGYLM